MFRIWFFWTPRLAAQVLRDFIEAGDFEVAFVVTGEDKAVGRHQVVTPNEVKTLATEYDIPVLQPRKIRGNTEFFDEIRSYEADYFVVVAYGKILPTELLHIPKKNTNLLPWQGEMSRHSETEGLIHTSEPQLTPRPADTPLLRGAGEIPCLNIHGSILPKYRGASPIQSALLAGDSETGVTIMCMSEGMDEWDIIDILRFPIEEGETSGSLFEKFAAVSGKFAIETIRKLDTGILTTRPQDNSLATYCSKIEKGDGLVDWSLDAKEIYHRWQGFTPWPGIFTTYEGKRLVIEECSFMHPSIPTAVIPAQAGISSISLGGDAHEIPDQVEDDDYPIGTIVRLSDKSVGVVCGKWILTLRRLKLEWKKSQSIEEFTNGHQNFVGSRLGK